MEVLVSLVIPTNGVIEWVFPVLDSIYEQSVNKDLFEVVVSDNGDNEEFGALMHKYCSQYSNLIYKKTSSKLFLNQIDAFKLANGMFIKFINHRTRLKEGSLSYLVDFVNNNLSKKPITFFLNGACEPPEKENYFSEFDSYVYGLKNFSSWSGGISCWKDDLNNILNSSNTVYELFPHTIFAFYFEENRLYNIENKELFEDILSTPKNKGNYDIFYAFGVEYVDIICDLEKKNLIDETTRKYVLQENEDFIAKIFLFYVILKKKCSYDTSSYRKSLNCNYSYKKIKKKAMGILIKQLANRASSLIREKK